MTDFTWFTHESLEPSPGTPEVDFFEFNGLKIAMPNVVSAGAKTVPLCGTWAMSLLESGRWRRIAECYIYIIRNLLTHDSYCGSFRGHIDRAPDPEPPRNPAVLSAAQREAESRRRAQGCFNFNLARFWKLPAEPGKYLLTVLLDEYQSNDFAFEIVEPQE